MGTPLRTDQQAESTFRDSRLATLRVALVCANDPTDPNANSGALTALLSALDELCDPIAAPGVIGSAGRGLLHVMGAAAMRPGELAHPRSAVARGRSRAEFGRLGVWVRSRHIAARLAAAGPVDGCIQVGTQFTMPDGPPRVTYDDTTVVQARASYQWPDLRDAPNAARWQARQHSAYLRARGCCTMSHWAARSIVDHYGIPESKVHVVGLGRNHEVVPPPDRDWSTPRFLFIGNDWGRKNGAAVVTAFRHVRAALPDARLEVVGEHPPLAGEGVICHGKLWLDNAGHRRRVAELLQTSTCLVMPSLNEPVGIVHAEAATAGLPSIGTRFGGPETVIGDGGLLVDPGSESELISAMFEIADPDRAQQLGSRAHARSHLFTWRKVAERMLRALELPGVDVSTLADFL